METMNYTNIESILVENASGFASKLHRMAGTEVGSYFPYNYKVIFFSGESYWKIERSSSLMGNTPLENGSLSQISQEEYKKQLLTLLKEEGESSTRGYYHGFCPTWLTIVTIGKPVWELNLRGVKSVSAFADSSCHVAKAVAEVQDAVKEVYRIAYEAECAEKAKADKARAAYNYKMGKLARKYGVGFNTARALETPEAITAFKIAGEVAATHVATTGAKARKSLMHEILECGRARRREALEGLGICLECDVNRIDREDLEKIFSIHQSDGLIMGHRNLPATTSMAAALEAAGLK